MWNLKDFSATKVLREIELGSFVEHIKNCHFDLFSGSEFTNWGFLALLCRHGIFSKIKIQGLLNGQNCRFQAPKVASAELDFTYFLLVVKLMTFHTVIVRYTMLNTLRGNYGNLLSPFF